MGHWGTCSLDFQQFIFSVTLQLHRLWQRLCAVTSPNVFVFCGRSCGSSVAATWTVFSEGLLFRVILCMTKLFTQFCAPRTRSWRRHWLWNLSYGKDKGCKRPYSVIALYGTARRNACAALWPWSLRLICHNFNSVCRREMALCTLGERL